MFQSNLTTKQRGNTILASHSPQLFAAAKTAGAIGLGNNYTLAGRYKFNFSKSFKSLYRHRMLDTAIQSTALTPHYWFPGHTPIPHQSPILTSMVAQR